MSKYLVVVDMQNDFIDGALGSAEAQARKILEDAIKNAESAKKESIISAKEEIEKTLDTINEAFVELLGSLFQDRVFDVTTDAQVLQTMLANEGLTKEKAFAKLKN